MKSNLLIFGGTFEGRMLAEGLSLHGIGAHIFTATDYGGALVRKLPHMQVHARRLNAHEMRHFMERHAIGRVIDATHPYAQEVTQNIVKAAEEAGVEYIRVIREKGAVCQISQEALGRTSRNSASCIAEGTGSRSTYRTMGDVELSNEAAYMHDGEPEGSDVHAGASKHTGIGVQMGVSKQTGIDAQMGVSKQADGSKYASDNEHANDCEHTKDSAPSIIRVAHSAEAVAYLAKTQGSVLLTTGSKELDVFCSLPEFQQRLYVRVLPMPEVIERCLALGLSGKRIIAMQGPFSYALNAALLSHTGCRYLVTKNTAQAGGLDEKIAAALDNGVEVVLIERPVQEKGLTLEEVFTLLGIIQDEPVDRMNQ